MINDFNAKPRFPFTYGDDISYDGERLSDFIVSKLSEKKPIRARVLNHLGKIGIVTISLILMPPPSLAVDPSEAASQVIGAEGGKLAAKETLNAALKIAKGKPALTTATAITFLACIPAAGAAASPGMCIACGILIAKTFG